MSPLINAGPQVEAADSTITLMLAVGPVVRADRQGTLGEMVFCRQRALQPSVAGGGL